MWEISEGDTKILYAMKLVIPLDLGLGAQSVKVLETLNTQLKSIS